jgi:hypothetical protein
MKLQLCIGVGERLSRQAKSLKGKPPTPVGGSAAMCRGGRAVEPSGEIPERETADPCRRIGGYVSGWASG